MSESKTPNSISQEPVNILFSPSSVIKKDVWEIDLIQILNLLIKILEKTGKKDLKVAGMAALSSSLIYRMKVESIFALQRAAMEKKLTTQRTDVDIVLIDIPYRHESTCNKIDYSGTNRIHLMDDVQHWVTISNLS